MASEGKLELYYGKNMQQVAKWSVQTDNYTRIIDGVGYWDERDLHVLSSGDHLLVEHMIWDKTYSLIDTELKFITADEARHNPYFHHYLKPNEAGYPLLSFGGLWVESIPVNVDLGVWYDLFLAENPEKVLVTVSRGKKV